VTRRRAALVAAVLVAGALSLLPAGAPAASLPPIRHVFLIVLENESASTSFGAASPAPYLAKTLTAEGAYLPHYYAVGHESNDNYIAMISGQAPGAQNQSDCQFYGSLEPGVIGSYGQAIGTGCVYPASVPTIASQLTAAGYTWRDYNESIGVSPTREASVCGHPAVNSRDTTQTATSTDEYAARHNPFVYFHSIIDNTTLCDDNVVNLDELPQDLSTVSGTANYSFITPDLCDDGHDSPCANGEPGGLAQADKFLQTWVPRITGSPAFRQNGLLIVTFDEAATSDTSSCCGEIAGPNSPLPGVTGPGGGVVGAVLLSPCIAPGTVSETAYNHYTTLGSVENLFGLAHLGYAGLPGEAYFGSDIFDRACGPPPPAGGGGEPPPTVLASAPVIASQVSAQARIPVRWSSQPAATYDVQVRDVSRRGAGWRTLATNTTLRGLTFAGALGHTYLFRVQADADGRLSQWAEATTIVPTAARVPGAHLSRGWRLLRRRGAWQQHALQTTRPGASLTLRYTGASVSLIGDRTARDGRLRITLNGRSRTFALGARRLRRRQILCTAKATPGVHRLTITDVRGLVALEGLAILDRTG
jgi:phosphatidylinositol-3-phosphatase